MLIFHEGLPRSGKSYETLATHIIPSLSKGRKVFARINGLHYEKIAELADISTEKCKELLIHIEEENVNEIPHIVENDALVVIDEIQNFFPAGRTKPADDIVKFVAEHGHKGLDIVIMGQSIADVHNLWRRRTQRKIQFLKMDMIGQENRYKWTAFQGQLDAKGEIRFSKVNGGVKKYDKQYFGSYASHQAETENTDNYVDKRLNIFNTPAFKYGVPAFVCVIVYAIYFLVGFFNGKGIAPEQAESKTEQQHVSTAQGEVPTQVNVSAESHKKPESKDQPQQSNLDFVMKNENRYVARMTYLERYKSMIWDFIVIWVDSGDRVQDRVYRDDLLAMGYTLKWVGYGVEAKKGDYTTVFRFRPSPEPVGRVSNNISSQLITSN